MSTKIFVGSLPAGTKPEELRHLFEGFGVVTECDVMNRCGFVHMEKPEMAANAIKALNSTDFKGETINVEPGRVRDRNQKPGGMVKPGGVGAGMGPRGPRGPRMPNGMMRMQNFHDMDPEAMGFDGIDEKTTKDALQLCSAVFEEMNKLLNPNQMGGRPGPRRGPEIGFPPHFVEDHLGMGGPRGPPMRGPRPNRNGPPMNAGPFPGPGPMHGPPGPRGPPLNQQGNRGGPKPGAMKPGPQARGPNQPNAGGRMGNPPNQGGFPGRNQANAGRVPKPGNVGPIRNDPMRPPRAAPYNRVGSAGNDIDFSDDIPLQGGRNFSMTTGSQIDRWPENTGNFGQSMNRNFDEDMPVDNFTDDAPIVINLVTRPKPSVTAPPVGARGNPTNHGNFGQNAGGGNDRFRGNNNDRFQGGNDRFQSNGVGGGSGGGGGGGAGNFGNQDRRGFALPENQRFNDAPKFGSSQFGGQNNQGNVGGGGAGGNRNMGFGNNNAGRQQNAQDSRGGGGNMGARRNNFGSNFDGNNMGNNRIQDTNRGTNFGGNANNRGMNMGGGSGGGGSGGNMNPNNGGGFNRNSNFNEPSNQINLHGPIRGNNRNMGNASNNRNMNAGGNNNRNMGGGMGGGMGMNNRNMAGGGGNTGNNMNRNMGGGGGGNQMNPINFQKDFPALPSGPNMNNRNGPRQNMMSNRRY